MKLKARVTHIEAVAVVVDEDGLNPNGHEYRAGTVTELMQLLRREAKSEMEIMIEDDQTKLWFRLWLLDEFERLEV